MSSVRPNTPLKPIENMLKPEEMKLFNFPDRKDVGLSQSQIDSRLGFAKSKRDRLLTPYWHRPNQTHGVVTTNQSKWDVRDRDFTVNFLNQKIKVLENAQSVRTKEDNKKFNPSVYIMNESEDLRQGTLLTKGQSLGINPDTQKKTLLGL